MIPHIRCVVGYRWVQSSKQARLGTTGQCQCKDGGGPEAGYQRGVRGEKKMTVPSQRATERRGIQMWLSQGSGRSKGVRTDGENANPELIRA